VEKKTTTTTTTQAVTTTTTAKPTTTTQAQPEYIVYDGGSVSLTIGQTIPMGVNTERHWGEAFAANTAGNCDWWFGLDYDLLETWNPNLSVENGAVIVLDADGKIVYTAVATEGVDFVAEIKDGKLVKSTLGHKDVMKDVNAKVPADGLLIFGNDFRNPSYPHIPTVYYNEIRYWSLEDFTTNVIFDYATGTNPELTRSYAIFDSGAGQVDFAGNKITIGFNTIRHWLAEGETPFMANTTGNCDWWFGVSQWLLEEWNPGYRVTAGVAAALDAEGHIVYMVIKGGEGINVVYEIVDGELVTSTYEEENIFKGINAKVPANGALIFGNNFGGSEDWVAQYPNLTTWTYDIVKTWTAADFQANVIFNQYQ
jgi:hypothetical protein